MLSWVMYWQRSLLILALLLSSLMAKVQAEGFSQAVDPPPTVLLAAMDGAAAARAAEARTGGKVLSVSREERNGKTVYRVKVLMPGGQIKNVYING